MIRALGIAATGMSAQALRVDVIANNIANISTTGFKRSRAEFTDLMYQAERAPGVANRSGNTMVPEGSVLGLGVMPVAIRNLHSSGVLTATGNKLDLAVTGRGWFQVTGANGEELYTRAGSFNRNAEGQLVSANGYLIAPEIVVPAGVGDVDISESGQVTVRVPGQVAPQQIGQITLASFVNDAGLEPLGGNLYRRTVASGEAVVGVPGEQGLGTIRQGYLEGSNVDPVKEVAELIEAQRAYEMNSKVIQAADDMAAVVSKGLR